VQPNRKPAAACLGFYGMTMELSGISTHGVVLLRP